MKTLERRPRATITDVVAAGEAAVVDTAAAADVTDITDIIAVASHADEGVVTRASTGYILVTGLCLF